MFDWETWRRVLGRVMSGRAGPIGAPLSFANLCTFSLWSAINKAALAADPWIFPAFESHEAKDPVFIVGNARSGTTLAHRLLCADEERFFHFDTWEILMPSLCQRRLIHMAGQLDHTLLQDRLERLVDWLDARAFGSVQSMHPIGFTQPEEDELLFVNCFATPVLFILFPYADPLEELTFFDGRPENERMKMMAWYRDVVRRRSFEAGSGRQLCSKNPSFVSKLRSLKAEFPRARFIYLVRDPRESLPSLLKALRKVWTGLHVAEPLRREAEAAIAEGCIRDYLYAEEVLSSWDPATWSSIRFQDLTTDPEKEIRRVYDHFAWDVSPSLAETLADARQYAPGHESEHSYGLEEFGLDADALRSRLRAVYERYELE